MLCKFESFKRCSYGKNLHEKCSEIHGFQLSAVLRISIGLTLMISPAMRKIMPAITSCVILIISGLIISLLNAGDAFSKRKLRSPVLQAFISRIVLPLGCIQEKRDSIQARRKTKMQLEGHSGNALSIDRTGKGPRQAQIKSPEYLNGSFLQAACTNGAPQYTHTFRKERG